MDHRDKLTVALCTRNASNQIAAALRPIIGDNLQVIDDPRNIPSAVERVDALFCPDFFYTVDVAKALQRRESRLAWIQLLTAGCDNVMRHGVPERVVVTNAGDAFAASVALHAVTLLLALCRQMPAAFENQRLAGWDRTFMPLLSTPEGMTISILGLGPIGRMIADLLKPWNPHLVGVSKTGRQSPHIQESATLANLSDVLQRSDAVLVALPLNADTDRLFDAQRLKQCKKGCFLINIARGRIVDNTALAAALAGGWIGGAALDVTEPEPLPPGHPLWGAPNVIVTPHIAGSSGAISAQRLAQMAAGNLTRLLTGQELLNVVKSR